MLPEEDRTIKRKPSALRLPTFQPRLPTFALSKQKALAAGKAFSAKARQVAVHQTRVGQRGAGKGSGIASHTGSVGGS